MSKSFTFRIISKLGIHISENEYSNISLFSAFRRVLRGIKNAIILKYCMYSIILSPLNYRIIRPYLWRKMGCKVGKKVFIGYGVWLDYNYAHLIEIGDNVHITNMSLLLCHQRDLAEYSISNDASSLPYKKGKIIIGKGVMIGMNSTLMPGITVGEGAIVGAKSLVTKDVPPWTIVAGNPARVIRYLKNK